MKIAVFALMTLGGFTIPLAAGQPEVLQGSGINEEALRNALVPKDGIRTRSFMPTSNQPCPEEIAIANILITFPTGSADLTPLGQEQADMIANVLKEDALKNCSFTIEGHADPRGGAEFNRWLSEARARALVEHLRKYIGVERLTAVGKGAQELWNKLDPTHPNNRRVTVVRKSRQE
ncbi:MAG: OmpA family protein [Nitrosospira sp.]|nr:OmpA family protein [Nitrosospira sp.]